MDIRPGPLNLITDVAGLTVGNAHDAGLRSGVTVILPGDAVVAAADIRGGAPGTRETALLDPANSVAQIHGLVFSGGSAFGLEAASAVVNWLAERGRGLPVGAATVPIVPAAILFDLLNGGAKDWGEHPPYAGLARRACDAAAREFHLGSAGAGYGALAGPLQGGIGSTSAQTADGQTPDGIVVGALVAANPVGNPVMPDGRTFWAWPWEQDAEYGGNPSPAAGASMTPDIRLSGTRLAANTTLAVVATNAALSKAQARRVAIMAHDGIARAVRPAHTPFDGDSVFCLATGANPGLATDATVALVGALAADCTARAIARAVYAASAVGAAPAYAEST